MMDTKYIVIDDLIEGKTAIVFGMALTHQQVAGSYKVVSAGFVSIAANPDGTVTADTYGESYSLKVGKLPGDDELVAKALGLVRDGEPVKWF